MDTPPEQPELPGIPPSDKNAHAFQGVIAVFTIASICALAFLKIEVKEPLYTLSATIISFYFGHSVGMLNGKNKS